MFKLSYLAPKYSFNTSAVDFDPLIMVSIIIQHPGMDQTWSAIN